MRSMNLTKRRRFDRYMRDGGTLLSRQKKETYQERVLRRVFSTRASSEATGGIPSNPGRTTRVSGDRLKEDYDVCRDVTKQKYTQVSREDKRF